MNNLDDFSEFKKLDPQNMLGEIDGLPDQLKSAWELGQTMPLPDSEEYSTHGDRGHGRLSDRRGPGSGCRFRNLRRTDFCSPRLWSACLC